MVESLLGALGLMLVLEGLLPLLAPSAWRETFNRLVQLRDGQLRFMGVVSIITGLIFLVFTR